jgi:hypothetical protein
VALAVALALLVAGCGAPAPHMYSHVSLRLPGGFRYAAGVTVTGQRQCLAQNLELIGRGVAPFEQVTRSCSALRALRPRLIESMRPAVRVILDQPAYGCPPVRVSGLGVAPAACSTAQPRLRLTVLSGALRPGAGVQGIGGVSSVPPPLSGCRHVCERTLG